MTAIRSDMQIVISECIGYLVSDQYNKASSAHRQSCRKDLSKESGGSSRALGALPFPERATCFFNRLAH